jgi:hypothetical protein
MRVPLPAASTIAAGAADGEGEDGGEKSFKGLQRADAAGAGAAIAANWPA